MSRRLLRLMSCVCMVAYALTNTHVNLAWSQYIQFQPVAQDAVSTSDPEPAGCKHCASRNKPSATASEQQRSKKPSSDCPDDPAAPNCPCCPNGDHSCPIPGGCSMCSVAKAPCLTEAPSPSAGESHVGESTVEYTVVYVSPFHASLIRPPRA